MYNELATVFAGFINRWAERPLCIFIYIEYRMEFIISSTTLHISQSPGVDSRLQAKSGSEQPRPAEIVLLLTTPALLLPPPSYRVFMLRYFHGNVQCLWYIEY